jgi:hypothetical protein
MTARRPDLAPRDPERTGARGRIATLGLLTPPGLAATITDLLPADLPGILARDIDGRVDWRIEIVREPLDEGDHEARTILDVCHRRLRHEAWVFALYLTDLPIYRDEGLVVAEVSVERRVAGVSLPAFGVFRPARRVRDAIVGLVGELQAGRRSPWDQDRAGDAGVENDPSGAPDGPAGNVPVAKRVSPTTDGDVDVRFVALPLGGPLRLLGGMALANRPWRLVPAFRNAAAAAFGTALYALVNTSIWRLGEALGWARLGTLTFLSIAALVVWVIVAHELWEPTSGTTAQPLARLYNAATALTVTAAVLAMYGGLFTLVFVAAVAFVPPDLLKSNLQHPAGVGDYTVLAWLVTSLATAAGALGSGLEDEGRVREAAYGYRQRRRLAERRSREAGGQLAEKEDE